MAWSVREIAELAGTSLRAVRQYHEIGLLEEPERRANGYKQYGVTHLVRVLRIKRLSDLGFSLAQVAAMGDVQDHPTEALRPIDAVPAATIKGLQRARVELGLILHQAVPTDHPSDFALAEAEAPNLPADPAASDFDHLLADAGEPTRQDIAEQLVPTFAPSMPNTRKCRTPTPTPHAGQALPNRQPTRPSTTSTTPRSSTCSAACSHSWAERTTRRARHHDSDCGLNGQATGCVKSHTQLPPPHCLQWALPRQGGMSGRAPCRPPSCRARALVDGHCLGENSVQSQVLEPVAEQLTRAFAGQPVAPVPAQQPITKFGLSLDRTLVGTLRWLKNPPADEIPLAKARPESKARNMFGNCAPLDMEIFYLTAVRARPGPRYRITSGSESSSISYSRCSSASGTS